jgi:DNA-binding Lrp family transcriptional regulator
MAKEIGIDEEGLLSLLKKYKKSGFIRRFGVILNHQKVGLKANALIAWKVKPQRIDRVVKILTKYPQVSHCYLRSSYSFWPYNLYTMLHATERKSCVLLIKTIAQKLRVAKYKVLFTLKEFKKTKLLNY